MEHRRRAINDLIAKMNNDPTLQGSVEVATLNYLRDFSTAADRARQAKELTRRFSELRAYGLALINGCSPRSKEFEKLLIIQEESSGLMEDNSGGAT